MPHPGLAIGFVGRLVPERGLDLLFRACVGLAGKWTLTVVGTGPSQEELEGLAQRLGIAARISWLGALPPAGGGRDLAPARLPGAPIRTTQRWVMTVGRAALHAMAHGVAVVGTDSGALPELVGDAGRIVPEEDVPALTAALQELYADRSRVRAPGRRGPAPGSGGVFGRGDRRENPRVLAHVDPRKRLTSGNLRAIFASHASI